MDEENTPWQYKPDNGSGSAVEDTPNRSRHSSSAKSASPKSVAWESLEFIEFQHGPGWYTMLVLVTAGLTALIYFIAHDKFAAGIIILVGIIVGVFVNQKPSRAKYEVTSAGLSINGKLYDYSGYKSFTIISEGDLDSLNLFPLRRLLPPLSAYFEPKDRAKIVAAIGEYLPYEERRLDAVEHLTRRLRI